MPRKLKTYQTSQGFYDLAIAAPSVKAALEASGASSNLFHQGFVKEADSDEVIAATMEKPGLILQRPVGSNEPFSQHSGLPTIESLGSPSHKLKEHAKKNTRRLSRPRLANRGSGKASIAFERERELRERQRQKQEAAAAEDRVRREAAISKAQAALETAEHEHEAWARWLSTAPT